MPCGIKTLQSIKKPFSIKTCRLIMNVLVTSHLNYPAILLRRVSTNLLISLEKQQSWAYVFCCDCVKFDISSDPKMKYNMIPIPMCLDWKLITHFWKKQLTVTRFFKSSILKLPDRHKYES